MISKTLKTTILAGVALLALSACAKVEAPAAAPSAATQGPLDAAQQAQVEALIGAYFAKHPETVEQAMAALQAQRQLANYNKIIADKRNFTVGPTNAKVHIVEFFDYRCGVCKHALVWSMDKIRTRKDVKFTFIEFPILTENSLEASRAAVASIKQGKYLAFHQAMMNAKGELSSKEIDTLAKGVGLDVARMRRDMQSPEVMNLLQANHDIAGESKVDGTPGFAINGKFFYGYDPEALDKGLREAASAKEPA